MKIIFEILHPSGDSATHLAAESFPVMIGRGYDNDIIIADPHVDPHHLKIDHADGAFLICDLDSMNGLVVDGITLRGESVKLPSGCLLRIGKTEIRLFAAHHSVTAAAPLQKPGRIFTLLSNAPFAWLCFAAAAACVAGWSYLNIWGNERIGVITAGAGTAIGIGIMIWAGIWAAAGRIIRHKSFFTAHVAVASLFVLASLSLSYISLYADYLTNGGVFSQSLDYFLDSILLALLLYGALTLSAQMPIKRRRLAAVYFAGGISLGIFLINLAGARSFDPMPAYHARLEPYLSRLAPAKSPESFMTENEEMFSTFKK